MKRKFKAILVGVSLLILGSCQFEVAFSLFPDVALNNDAFTAEMYVGYSRPTSFVNDYRDVLLSNQNPTSRTIPLHTVGQQKILVLPVNFVDYDLNDLDGNNGQSAHIQLQNAFFGANDATSWRSVTGFYYESSYGRLKLSGEVAPWYTLPSEYSVQSLLAISSNNSATDKLNETQKIVNLALLEYQRLNPGILSEYDLDNDGIVDSIYIVYSAPYVTRENNNIFWAFAANMYRPNASLEKQANAYAWSSFHYLNLENSRKPDAHTFIHEVAHLLGLTDYYNTNYEENYSPLGGFDMMDYTLGDHTGFSKLLLNWTRPYIVSGNATIKLYSFVETGELILLKNEWNGSATDEYLLLEYYTPTHLNELDSRLNAAFKLPNAYGVKVYHVDARLAFELKEERGASYVYEKDFVGEFTGLRKLAHTNTTGSKNSAPMKDYTLYSLLEPKESGNIRVNHGLANTNSLFKKGDDFGYTYFKDYTFNDGVTIGYKFIVQEMTREYATIRVEVI